MKSKIVGHQVEMFKKIQKMDGISSIDFLYSLNIQDNLHNIFKSGQGAGKSGSFFFFSKDNKFIIKTMRGNEKPLMTKIVDGMVKHLEQTNGKSLLARYYGMFTVRTDMF